MSASFIECPNPKKLFQCELAIKFTTRVFCSKFLRFFGIKNSASFIHYRISLFLGRTGLALPAVTRIILTKMNLQNLLAESVAEALRQGATLLGEMTDEIYVAGEQSGGGKTGGAIGGHFRHCLEFVNCFLAGAAIGKIDYGKRERKRLIEIDRLFAVDECRAAIRAMEQYSAVETGKTLLVKPEDIAEEAGEDFWCASSVERELEFLQSHTIHHYALIGFKLRAMNFHVPPEFGVAASTLRFWTAEANARTEN